MLLVSMLATGMPSINRCTTAVAFVPPDWSTKPRSSSRVPLTTSWSPATSTSGALEMTVSVAPRTTNFVVALVPKIPVVPEIPVYAACISVGPTLMLAGTDKLPQAVPLAAVSTVI